MSDIVERLRKMADQAGMLLTDPPKPSALMELLTDAAAEIERLRAGRAAVVEECANLLDLRRDDILLIAGEMSAQEVRSVRAMLNERARAIRALKETP
mgnify:CR=1 FL=1